MSGTVLDEVQAPKTDVRVRVRALAACVSPRCRSANSHRPESVRASFDGGVSSGSSRVRGILETVYTRKMPERLQ